MAPVIIEKKNKYSFILNMARIKTAVKDVEADAKRLARKIEKQQKLADELLKEKLRHKKKMEEIRKKYK